ncbi:MAG: hypothetical protein ACI9F9_002226 [Candidatus Paceibacteria bacterium]
MLLTRIRHWGIHALASCCLLFSAAAQTSGEGGIGPDPSSQPTLGKAGEGHLGMQLGFFNTSDSPGDGNPFLDEALTVIEPVIVYDYNVTDRLNVGAKLSYDLVSSASIDRLSEYGNGEQSGASGDNYVGSDFNFLYQKNRDWTLGGHLGASFEYDYFSLGFGLNAAQDLKNADATLSYSLDVYQDTVDIIRYDGTQDEGEESRTSISASFNWYQILSPKSHGTFGVTLAQQDGFLETPYNGVVVEGPNTATAPPFHNGAIGREYQEELPDSRSRVALYGRVLNSLGRGHAWEMGGRLYTDSWGVNSVTVEPRYIVSLVEDKLDLRLRYRYYTQTAADDFGEHFSALDADSPSASELPGERTQDSDLGAYDAHTVGTKWTWFLAQEDTFTLNLDYTLRSDGLDQIFASVAYIWSF